MNPALIFKILYKFYSNFKGKQNKLVISTYHNVKLEDLKYFNAPADKDVKTIKSNKQKSVTDIKNISLNAIKQVYTNVFASELTKHIKNYNELLKKDIKNKKDNTRWIYSILLSLVGAGLFAVYGYIDKLKYFVNYFKMCINEFFIPYLKKFVFYSLYCIYDYLNTSITNAKQYIYNVYDTQKQKIIKKISNTYKFIKNILSDFITAKFNIIYNMFTFDNIQKRIEKILEMIVFPVFNILSFKINTEDDLEPENIDEYKEFNPNNIYLDKEIINVSPEEYETIEYKQKNELFEQQYDIDKFNNLLKDAIYINKITLPSKTIDKVINIAPKANDIIITPESPADKDFIINNINLRFIYKLREATLKAEYNLGISVENLKNNVEINIKKIEDAYAFNSSI